MLSCASKMEAVIAMGHRNVQALFVPGKATVCVLPCLIW